MTVETHVRIDGHGPPLVLVHGVGLDHTMWDSVMDELTVTHRVIRYDLLGHGRSEDPPGPRSIDDFLDQLTGVLAGQGLARPDLAGLSLGGLIAMGFAARHPERVGRLALLNTVFERSAEQLAAIHQRYAAADEGGMTAVADLAVDRWFTPSWRSANPRSEEAVRTRLLANDPPAYLKAYRVFIDGDPIMPAGAREIAAPTLAMTGALDPGSTPAMSHALARVIANGKARILPDLHHIPPIEAPAVFTAALLDFLDQEAPA